MTERNRTMILLGYQPLTTKMEQDFYLARTREEGVKVEYWDLTEIYNKGLKMHGSLDREFIKRFSSLAEVASAVKQSPENTLFVVFMTYEFKILRLLRIFTVYDRRIAFFARGMMPFPLLKESFIRKLRQKFKLITDFRYVKNYFSNKIALIAKKLKWVKVFDIVFAAGSEGYNTVGIGAHMDHAYGKIVPINAVDYDKMMSIRNQQERLVDFKYCVFLDVYLPYHPDFKIAKIDQVSAEPYYAALNRFFGSIEAKYDVKVVIAAHPKADYTSNPFEGRTIIKSKTAELVKDCEFAVAHHSTSVSFAVLFEKPLVFIYESEIKRLYKHTYLPLISHFAKVLNAVVCDINTDDGEWKLKTVDKDKYKDYKYKYLTSPETEHLFTEDVVMEILGPTKASYNGQ